MNPIGGKILVTGANGFIGRALCEELASRDFSVVGAARNPSNLDSPDYPLVQITDIGPETDWSIALNGVDVVIHLAARVHVMHEESANPMASFRAINLHGTTRLARSAVAAGVKRLVYVSSIGVNGLFTRNGEKFSETDVPAPHNSYALSKWEAEQSLHEIAQETGLEIVVVRPPLVYGPDARGNFPKLLAAVGKGLPFPLKGAGNARSLIYVGNLVDALIACATHPASAGQTYLVSDGEDVSTAELVEKIAGALKCRYRSFYFPRTLLRAAAALVGRSSQVDQLFGSLCVNDAKIRHELSWTPPYTLDQGLRATADWYRRQKADR